MLVAVIDQRRDRRHLTRGRRSTVSDGGRLTDADFGHAIGRQRRAQIELGGVGDFQDGRAVALDRLPGGDENRGHHPRNRRTQRCSVELHHGGPADGVGARHRALRGHQLRLGVVDFLPRRDAVLPQLGGAIEPRARVGQLRVGLLPLRVGLGHAIAQRLRLDVRQRLTGPHHVALGHEQLVDAPLHQRADFDVAARGGVSVPAMGICVAVARRATVSTRTVGKIGASSASSW